MPTRRAAHAARRSSPAMPLRSATTGAAAAFVAAALALGAAQPAAADQGQIDAAVARVAALEAESAAASQRAVAAAGEVQRALERRNLFARHAQEARAELAGHQRILQQLARQLYVNGGVSNGVLSFSLDDPDEFLASLDQLAAAGDAQNDAVVRARATAMSLRATELAMGRAQERLAASAEIVTAEQATAGARLASARAELLLLQEEERARVAAAVAAQREAQRLAAAAASSNASGSGSIDDASAGFVASGPVGPGDNDPMFAQSSAWAAGAKQQSVIQCESSGNYSINTGNGYYGAWQFDYPSWHANGGGRFAQFPHQATKAQQDYVAWTYWQRSGWRPWACG